MKATFRPSKQDHEVIADKSIIVSKPNPDPEEDPGNKDYIKDLKAERAEVVEVADADLLADKTDMSLVKVYTRPQRDKIFPTREHEIDKYLRKKADTISSLITKLETEAKDAKETTDTLKVEAPVTGGQSIISRNVVRAASEYLASLRPSKRSKKRA